LTDLGRVHAARQMSLSHPLDGFHKQVALGECGLAWAVMCHRKSKHTEDSMDGSVIPLDSVRQWFGEERLPEGWWDKGVRPQVKIGLFEARRRANAVEMSVVSKSTGL